MKWREFFLNISHNNVNTFLLDEEDFLFLTGESVDQ
jgi:hypothetical protein